MSTASVIGGSVLAALIVCTPEPEMLNAIVSTVGKAWPAAHSPAAAPEAVFVLAAMIASRSVQAPSLAVVSAVLLTVIVLADASTGRRSRARATTVPKRRRPGPRFPWNSIILMAHPFSVQ